MFWSLELAIELKMSVLEQSGKSVLTTEKNVLWLLSRPFRLLHTAQPRPGYLLFLLHNVCSFQSRLCIQKWKAVLEEPCDQLSTYEEPTFAETGVGRVPQRKHALKTVFKMEKYCIFSKILFPRKTNTPEF